jgi:TPR repeat protein
MSRLLTIAAIWVVTAVLAAEPAAADKRVALIIGNSSYEHVPALSNPATDTADVAAALERLGFEVERVTDQSHSEMRNGLRSFRSRVAGADIAVVYYAGHGIEVDKQNYLVPTDAILQSDGEIEYEAIPLDLVMRSVETARKLRLVIVDACRENPFLAQMKRSGASRSIGRGLARVEPTGNTLVAFAAKEGTTAADGDGRNSPFATALLSNIEEPGLEIGLLFRRVRDEVLISTGGDQEPFLYGSLSSEGFYLKPAEVPARQETVRVEDVPRRETGPSSFDSAEIEITFWNTVKDSNDPNMLRTYLARYSDGAFADLAQILIGKLEGGSYTGARAEQRASLTPGTQTEPAKTGAAKAMARDIAVQVEVSEIEVGGTKRSAIGAQVGLIGAPMARALGLPANTGTAVISLITAGPADLAGIRPGDVVVRFNEQNIETMSDLPRLSAAVPAGNRVTVEMKRYGQGLGELLSVLEKAADDGDLDAAWTLHRLYADAYGGLDDARQKHRWARTAARGGDPDMQYAVSLAYQNGDGIEADEAEALRWARLAADQGHGGAFGYVGLAYEYGRGVDKDIYEALRWFRKGADSGDSYSIYSLGYAYAHAQAGLPEDHHEAMRWYRKAADLGRSDAQYQISIAYQNGEGVETDDIQALDWARKAATQNHRTALAYVGYAYEQGKGVGEDMTEALKWYRKAAELENAYGEYKLGRFYEHGLGGLAQDPAESVRWYLRSAEHGDDDAQAEVGYAYLEGIGVAKDEAEAERWIRKSAEQGNSWSEYKLGELYEEGSAGLSKDVAEAYRWYLKSAEQGYGEGEFKVGYFLMNGLGTAKNEREAIEWYEKAIAQDQTMAFNNLGAAYDSGTGVAKNPERAAELMFESIKRGNEFSLDQMRDNIAAWTVPFRRELQRLLRNEGLYPGAIDGQVGPGTTRALERLYERAS